MNMDNQPPVKDSTYLTEEESKASQTPETIFGSPLPQPTPLTPPKHPHLSPIKVSYRRFPSRKAEVTAKKPSASLHILKWWSALVAIAVVAAVVISGFYLWEAYRLEATSGVSTELKISGNLGEQPVLELEGQLPFTLPKSHAVITGTGPLVQQSGDVRVMVSVFEGDTGKFACKNGKPHLYAGKANAQTLPGGLLSEVVDKREGTRLVLRRPASNSNGKTAMEIDVIDILPTAVYATDIKIPQPAGVSFSFPQGLPKFEAAAQTRPKEAATYVLVPGNAEQLNPKKKVIAQYGVWELDSGKNRVYTWGKTGPQEILGDSVYQSLAEQLTDLRVNSRILAIIPADQATGDSALAVVMDVLAAGE